MNNFRPDDAFYKNSCNTPQTTKKRLQDKVCRIHKQQVYFTVLSRFDKGFRRFFRQVFCSVVFTFAGIRIVLKIGIFDE